MPVEIREIVIKTVIQSNENSPKKGFTNERLQTVKRELMEECKRLINQNNKNNRKKR
jgi:hypothetical protein